MKARCLSHRILQRQQQACLAAAAVLAVFECHGSVVSLGNLAAQRQPDS